MKKQRDSASVNSMQMRRSLQRYFPIFLLPMVASFVIGFVWPFCQGMFLSFTQFKTTSKWTWVGIQNYIKVFKDENFLYSFIYTAVFAAVSLVIINVLAFAVAYALTRKIRGANLFRTVFFMPNLIGGVILGYIWQLIFNGILQYYATNIKLNATFGFLGLVILLCWQQIGYMMIIYISGLSAIPDSLYEAARVDGATRWQTLRKITLPMMMPSITICTFLTLTNSFKLFDQNLALTAGEPGVQIAGKTVYQTEMLALNIYNTFYRNANTRGVGQAKAVVFFLLVAVIALAQLYFTRRKEEQM